MAFSEEEYTLKEGGKPRKELSTRDPEPCGGFL